ncbi:fibronectin type III domain-containing protein [Hymenobacter algoricola]|uniref:Fibronectin type-III domain-containing protein n=1 Tax=Hymenobacter algoricola TaxID=486267 RepID=A0ABP7MGV8_9BACT
MKNVTFLAVLLGAATGAHAQSVMSISAARAAGPGATVTVRGTVTNGPELGAVRYVQDREAGLAAFSSSALGFSALIPGDSVELRGTLKNYNGLLEMDPVTSVRKLAAGRRVVPVEVLAANMMQVYSEAYEGRLVKIKSNMAVTTPSGVAIMTFNGNTNYLLNGQRGATVRISNSSAGELGIVGKPAPSSDFDLMGVMGQFAPSGSGGYQLLPRLYSDMLLGGGLPNVLGEPIPTDMSRDGFTVTFATQNAGDTKVEYGRTSELGTVVMNATPTTRHSVVLTNLQPGTVYYVKVSSTNAVGTSATAAVPMITDTKKRSSTRGGRNAQAEKDE